MTSGFGCHPPPLQEHAVHERGHHAPEDAARLATLPRPCCYGVTAARALTADLTTDTSQFPLPLFLYGEEPMRSAIDHRRLLNMLFLVPLCRAKGLDGNFVVLAPPRSGGRPGIRFGAST